MTAAAQADSFTVDMAEILSLQIGEQIPVLRGIATARLKPPPLCLGHRFPAKSTHHGKTRAFKCNDTCCMSFFALTVCVNPRHLSTKFRNESHSILPIPQFHFPHQPIQVQARD
jgi:hypothetical protein